MEPFFRGYSRAGAFLASDAPQLAIDTDLVIRDTNPAYLMATKRTHEELVGMPIFEAFPDNPDDPHANGVKNLSASFEIVFREARSDHMPIQRYDIPCYDIPSSGPRPKFVRKFWTPVNTPLRDEAGRVIGALHHVEDVTDIADFIVRSAPRSLTDPGMDQHAWTSLVAALAREALGHQQARVRAEQLQRALTSRVMIEQAKGMIAAREGISIDQAFARLRQHARRHSAPLHDIARAVIELGLTV